MMPMKMLRAGICWIFVLGWLAGMGAVGAVRADEPVAQPPALNPVTSKTVVAEVNGHAITFAELEKHVYERIPNVTGHGTISPDRLRQRAFELLDQMILDEVMAQEATRLKIRLDRKKLDAEVSRQRGLFPSAADFQKALTQRNLTEALFRQRIERAMLMQAAVDQEVNQKVTVTDDEMAAYYRDHPEKFVIPMQYRLRLLLVSVDPSATPEIWERAGRQAVELRERGRKGEDFGKLAREFSGDAETRERGGDSGLVHHGQLGLPEIEHAVESLNPGEITEPIRTIYGLYLARVEERQPGRQQSFADVNKALFRQELTEAKHQERYQEWVASLISRAKITRLPPSAAATP